MTAIARTTRGPAAAGRLATTMAAAIALLLLAPHDADAFVLPRGQHSPLAATSYGRIESDLYAGDDAMLPTYESLASRVVDLYEKEKSAEGGLRNDQLFVCVAGGPGSGKSTLSEAVAERVNDMMKEEAAVVLPMDGFHYTRAQLKSIGESDDNEHTPDDLIARRGAPWTFDAEGCVEMFTQARIEGKASLPIYSREKSDPVPDGVELSPDTKIVFLEGNYLLAWADDRWAPLKGVFDETWYIGCKKLDDQRERLVMRHLETWSDEKSEMFGEGKEGAGAKADSNDMLNLIWIEDNSKQFADLFIESI